MNSGQKLLRLLTALLLSGGIAVLVDITAAFYGSPLPSAAFLIILLLVLAVTFMLKLSAGKIFKLGLTVIAAYALYTAIFGAIYLPFAIKADYSVNDNGKAELFADRKVLVLSPHQDDEINVAEGVMEEYLNYGSKVYLGFLTNGDYIVPGETRLREVLSAADILGIPMENVYFLGYGDKTTPYIYISPDNETVASVNGHSSTYGIENHPAYRQGADYTRNNLKSDMKSLILELKPDTIMVNEVECHVDHAALKMFFDEVMREILLEDESYRPLVLESSCYATSYYGIPDFFSVNIKAVADPDGNGYYVNNHDWKNRIRLPVDARGLSRSLYSCNGYKLLREHKSQEAGIQAEGVINGDKIFWLRDTSSLTYKAEISSSSGESKYVNDFKLLDSIDLTSHIFTEDANLWTPDSDDNEKILHLNLQRAGNIDRIVLYDNISADDNILDAEISFDDGSKLRTGPLKENGAPTVIPVKKENIKEFSLRIIESKGDKAGIAELEAFESPGEYGLEFIKLQNKDGDFVYDYLIDESGEEEFEVYESGSDKGKLSVNLDNPCCSAVFEENKLKIFCPQGESTLLTVSSEDGRCSDTVRISNRYHKITQLGQSLEQLMRDFRKIYVHDTNCFKILKAVL